MNTELDNFSDDDNYFELENADNKIEDEDNEQDLDNDSEESEEDIDDEYEENGNEEEGDDEIDNDYDNGYSIGYFTINDDKEVVESDEPRLIRLMEDSENYDEYGNFYDNMLDDVNSDEPIDETEYDEDSEMYDDPEFKTALYINSELTEFNESFQSIKNPYFALNALRDYLFTFNLILPHFDLPSGYDEWIFDVTLDNKSEYNKTKYICHIEILCGETDDCYSVNAGVYPK